MPSQPLQPFAPPAALLAHLPSGLSGGFLVMWLLYAVLAFWAIITLIAIYHWLEYSHGSWISLPAIALHLFVSLTLISYALSGTFAL